MNILVCGGAGFIGSNFIRFLLKKYPEYYIVNFDKLTYAGNLDNLREVEKNPHYIFVKGDIVNQLAVERVITENNIQVIINYAAETHVDRSIHDPEAFLKTDVLGVYHLLEATKKYNLKKFIQISTDEVYGSIEKGAFTEESSFSPNSPYSAAKAGGDHLVHAYSKTYHTPVIITHSCNIYGPHQYPEKIIPLFVTNLLEGKKIPLYGDGKNVREWLHVADHCRAIEAILHTAAPGSIYNIGSGIEKTNNDLSQMILKNLGRTEAEISWVKDRPGHDRRYAIDHTKITEELGWQPEISFEDGIRETILWYQENVAWWKKIKNGEYVEYYKKQYS
jgi:dTDP-glucose 4,6-dehydratase